MQRNKLYQLINIAKSQLGLDEDLYRELLESFGASLKNNKYSLTTMSDKQLQDLYLHFESKGFVTKTNKYNKKYDVKNTNNYPINTRCGTWRQPLIRKIVAQWNDLYNQGKVKNRSLESCRRYCVKQVGVDKLEWFSTKDFNRCIEGLKQWQSR